MADIGRRWMRLLAVAATIAMMSLSGRPPTAAQEGMPGTESVTPDPALCQVAPRTIDDLRALFASATPAVESAAPSRTVPSGHPADEATAAGVVATVQEAFACLNAGDFLRFFALLTDDAILTVFPWVGEAIAGDQVPPELAAPVVVADQQQTLLAVAGISRLADGRVGAVIAFLDPASDATGADALYLIFVLQGERWRIDGVIDFGEE